MLWIFVVDIKFRLDDLMTPIEFLRCLHRRLLLVKKKNLYLIWSSIFRLIDWLIYLSFYCCCCWTWPFIYSGRNLWRPVGLCCVGIFHRLTPRWISAIYLPFSSCFMAVRFITSFVITHGTWRIDVTHVLAFCCFIGRKSEVLFAVNGATSAILAVISSVVGRFSRFQSEFQLANFFFYCYFFLFIYLFIFFWRCWEEEEEEEEVVVDAARCSKRLESNSIPSDVVSHLNCSTVVVAASAGGRRSVLLFFFLKFFKIYFVFFYIHRCYVPLNVFIQRQFDIWSAVLWRPNDWIRIQLQLTELFGPLRFRCVQNALTVVYSSLRAAVDVTLKLNRKRNPKLWIFSELLQVLSAVGPEMIAKTCKNWSRIEPRLELNHKY